MRNVFVALFVLISTLSFAQTQKQMEVKDGKVVISEKVIELGSFGYGGQSKGLVAKATSHSVTLSCTASTSSGVTGYNFYRGSASGAESTTPLNASPVSTCGYVDTNVLALTQYFYNAKAFCPTCSPNTSVASNEINITVPGDPQPAPPVMNPATGQ